MALTYEEVARFARENGDVKGWAKQGILTLLNGGEVHSVKFWEEDSARFEYAGKFYKFHRRDEFERLVRSRKPG